MHVNNILIIISATGLQSVVNTLIYSKPKNKITNVSNVFIDKNCLMVRYRLRVLYVIFHPFLLHVYL
jgi:hypothetical protein